MGAGSATGRVKYAFDRNVPAVITKLRMLVAILTKTGTEAARLDIIENLGVEHVIEVRIYSWLRLIGLLSSIKKEKKQQST